MSELPEIVHRGMTLEFEGFGTIIVGDFSNNGTNAAIHHCENNENFAVKIHRAKKKQDGELNLHFTSELDFPVNSELLAIPVSSTVVDLQKGRASLVLLMPQLFEFQMLRDFFKTNLTSLEQRLSIARSILLGLSAIHESGWLHGDLSDRNIMINPATNDIKFIDFEWSVKQEEAEFVEDGDVMKGTPEMVSPEVRHYGSKALSVDAEVWSVCKILMQLLDNSIVEQFREVDVIGFKQYLSRLGLDKPMYKLENKSTQMERFVSFLERGTCGSSLERPPLSEILKSLESIDDSSSEISKFTINHGDVEITSFNSNSLGIDIEVNDEFHCMVRNGKKKKLDLGNNVVMEVDYTSSKPKISIMYNGQNFPIPLAIGTEFGNDGTMNFISKINEL